MKVFIKLFCIMTILISFAGCAFNELKGDLEKQEDVLALKGVVHSQKETTGPIIVVLVKDYTYQPIVVNYTVLAEPGSFEMYAEEGRYRIFVYEDRNRDQNYQPHERMGFSSEVVLSPNQDVSVEVSLPDMPDIEAGRAVKGYSKKVKSDLVNSSVHSGTIVKLDSEIFSEDNVKMGLWQPLKMATELPIGIFFLEEYNHEKKPILFVHGVSGSPLNFESLIANIDKTKFQVWIAYYPSGFSLPIISSYLESQLLTLQAKYNFKTISLVAHSMGGLVSRAMINDLLQNGSSFEIDRFISISTPWSGHEAAATGVKWAPTVIPSWRDVSPGSEFLTTLVERPLPTTIPHYLLFSFRGNSSFARGNSDGVVSIASQLRYEVQEDAALVRGYHKGHTEILNDKEVSRKINDLLIQ